jgi:hypothetical protein
MYKIMSKTIILAGLFFAYFASRLYGLTLLPLFLDEGTCIQRAMDVWKGEFLKPLIYGKLLQVWLLAFVVPWATDLLWASRFITVLSGSVTMWACYAIGRRLYDRRAGLFSAGLYIASPFTLFYDRLALADGLLSTFAALTLLASIALMQTPRRAYAWVLGISMALGILVKIPGVLILMIPILVHIFFPRTGKTPLWKHFSIAYGIVLVLCMVPASLFLKTTGEFQAKAFILSNPQEFLIHVQQNSQLVYEWLSFYWTKPVVILGMLGFIIALIERRHESIILFLLSLLPIAIYIVISRWWFPRYILFATIPFLVLSGWSLLKIINVLETRVASRLGKLQVPRVRIIGGILLFVIVISPAWPVNYRLWTNPALTPLPKIERFQYIESWPSGYGVAEAAGYFYHEASEHPEGIIVVRHEMSDASYPGLAVYLKREHRVKLHDLNLNKQSAFTELATLTHCSPTFVVLTKPPISDLILDQPDMERLLSIASLVQAYRRPGGESTIEIYRVRESKSNSLDEWKGEYFNDICLTGRPIMVKDDGDSFLDVDRKSDGPASFCGLVADNFSVRWTRTVNFNAVSSSSAFMVCITSE